MKVLITAGGTEEALDGVRRLSNTSTGATGLALARFFAEHGAEVVLLHAARVDVRGLPFETESWVTFDDLASALENHLGTRHYDAVIHLAAVSDYRLASAELDGLPVAAGDRGKIGTGRELVLRLHPNPKLIDSLRCWSRNPEVKVVGFKLTDDPDAESRAAQVNTLLERGVADLVVHNDIREIGPGRHLARIHTAAGVAADTTDKNEMAQALLRLLAAGEY